MSGFGGGFGNPAPGGFGFGAPAPPSSGFGSTGFGSPPAAPAPSGFGNSNSNAPFGGGGFGGGGSVPAPTTFAAPASFGGSQPATFGAPSNSGFGTSTTTTGFGSPAPATGFGQPSGFGGSTGFGNSNNNNNNNNNSPFGAPFGQQQQQPQQQGAQPMMDVPNPFGGGAAQAPSVSFGMSSNVVTGGNAPMNTGGSSGGGGGGMTFAAPANSGFGNNANAPSSFPSNPFGGGSSAPAAAPFGNSSSSSGGGMTFGSSSSSSQQQQHNRQQSSGSVEMGGSDSPTPMSAFGGTFHSTGNAATNSAMDGSLSPIPEDNAMSDPFGSGPSAASAPGRQQQGGKDDKADELARLKAKIEAKRKKLADRKQKKKDRDGGANDDGGGGGGGQHQDQQQQQQSSRSRGEGGSGRERRGGGRSSSPAPDLDPEQLSRKERNAIRFKTTSNTATQAHMPSELRGKSDAPKPSVTSAVGGEANREDLAKAKSLIGTCLFMCPDEELLRRERENDIQLLEMPDPGGIHPPGWGLRQTAVKRFRRSAADYKLDVPEWVRPPDVLEQTCSYLEEWVMERDRQGPDRRFPQNGTPNSLDVYQFIWDRTRMIRKDFILQNYVGTGGKCDARAVRCHERIARWHAMCEHQLSHISDFVVQQSQQNIAELGQAMKTLNQYYDDSMGRAYIEAPDDQGRETRTNINDFSHGCQSDACLGGNPIDYDGSPLNNTADIAALQRQRLIGKAGVNSPSRGTAECEMRALYILLTMNNDGGMEVMRYSAALYRERPEVYNSKPVQLALEIFKAKKDYNYVRFFKILRDPATPYLFACLMFKHIETMRKIAFRMMWKAYGAKKKDTGEPIYDGFPLKRFAHILCFEDMDEARAACKHYNITVKAVRVSSGDKTGMAECVFWKHSEFKEPKDPAKGTILPLRPRKMIRYIESKLNGATRLGVCRGEASGEGASLTQPPQKTSRVVSPDAAPSSVPTSGAAAPQVPASSGASIPAPAPATVDIEAAKAEEFKRQQEKLLAEAAAKKEQEKQAKIKEAKERLEAERLQKEREKEKKRRMEEKKRQLAAKLAEERRLKEEEEKRKKEQAEREERERKKKEAERLKEEARKKAEAEAARKKAEAEERERQRLEAIRLEKERIEREKREAEERRMREEAERIRKEQEKQRLETLRAQEEERKRREALKRKAEQELQERVDKARKIILLRRLREQLPRSFQSAKNTRECLKRMDPTFSSPSPFTQNFVGRELALAEASTQSTARSQKMDMRKILNRILANKTKAPLDVTSLLLDKLYADEELLHFMRPSGFRLIETEGLKSTILLKVGVVLPEPDGLEETSMYESIHSWLNRRLEYGKVDILDGFNSRYMQNLEVRVLFVKADSWARPVTCDAVLHVIPPSFCSGDWSCSRKIEALTSAFECAGPDAPVAASVLVLGERFEADYYNQVNEFLAECLPSDSPELKVFFPSDMSVSAVERSLQSSLKSLIQAFTDDAPPSVEQVSAVKLASKCITDTLWTESVFDSSESARAALSALIQELDKQSQSIEESWSSWPADDFATENGFVQDYFCQDLHLPIAWAYHGFRDKARRKLEQLHEAFQEANVPLAITKLIGNAPSDLRRECDDLIENRHYRKCIQLVLQSGAIADELLFLPHGVAEEMVESTIQSALRSVGHFRSDLQILPAADADADSEVPPEDQLAMTTRPRARVDSVADELEATDDAGVFKRAQDIFQISRTISPVPPGAASTPTPSERQSPAIPGTEESPPPGVQSNYKRSWSGMSEGGSDRAISPFRSPFASSPYGSTPSGKAATKRQRRSQDEIDSSAFTRKLQALYSGGATVDMEVGGTSLSRLVRDLPLRSDND